MDILVAPIVFPFLLAGFCLLFRDSLKIQRWIAGFGTHGMLVLAFYLLMMVRRDGIAVLRVGDWPQTFGIVFTLDLLGAIMLCLAAITHTTTWWYIVSGATRNPRETAMLHPMFLLLAAGVNWAFSTGDLFNLFVSFEIILICSYVLLSHGCEKNQVRESVKFVALNIIASTFFLVGAGLTYAMFGSLNMADLAVRIQQTENVTGAVTIGTLFLIVFGIKAALFPMFYWLPNAYPRAPLGVLPYFAGILTKVGVYCLYRSFTLIFRIEMADWFQPLFLVIAAGTMLIGVLCAMSQWSFRRILSFHIISQIGYMIFGLGIFTPLALAGGVFYIIHHIIVKASLFMIGGCVKVNEGTDELKRVHGVIHGYPFLSILFVLAAFSLAGVPPLSGFYGKYALALEGIVEGHYFYVAISILTSLFTLYSMVKIWQYAFWGEMPTELKIDKIPHNDRIIAATAGLVAVSVIVALASGWVMNLAIETSNQLLDQSQYIHAVMGDRGVEALQLAANE